MINSGLTIGSDYPAFDPTHVSGPDQGKNACPMCKYGKDQGMMVWWNKEDMAELAPFAQNMERVILEKGFNNLRVFIMYMNTAGKPLTEIENMLKGFSKNNNLKNVALTYIPSPTDAETAGLYEINPKAFNTIFIYKRRKVIDKFINYNLQNTQKVLLQKLHLQLPDLL